MNDHPNLVTTYAFKEKEYLVKMNVINGKNVELCVTDKYTAEDWQCSYDATYIENLTHKTGNFKQFDIFTTMLKSGLLKVKVVCDLQHLGYVYTGFAQTLCDVIPHCKKERRYKSYTIHILRAQVFKRASTVKWSEVSLTSECISLDLLTFEDLEILRNRRIIGHKNFIPQSINTNHLAASSNRRYLILTYTVEFDRIHYPLPMEYCGPPDSKVLQGTIRRLELEITRLQEELLKGSGQRSHAAAIEQILQLKKRVQELATENRSLKDEVHFMNKNMTKQSSSHHQIEIMQSAMRSLEENVMHERTHFQRFVRRMREEKAQLIQQVEELRSSERNLQTRLHHALQNNVSHWPESCYPKNKANLITSRHSGDGLGSPLLDVEFGARNIKSKSTYKSPKGQPGWETSIQDHNMQQMSVRLDNTKRRPSPLKTQSIDYLPTPAARHHRSSSESSTVSKKCTPSYHTKNTKIKKSVNEITKFTDTKKPLQYKVSNRDRGRLRVNNTHTKRSSSSGSSACSRSAPQVRTRLNGGSKHSSPSSTSSRHLPTRQGSENQTLVIHKFKAKRHKATKDLKLGMSDLESRIHALQNLLKNGMTIK